MKACFRDAANLATFIVTICQASGQHPSGQCGVSIPINKTEGYLTPCGDTIRSCMDKIIVFPDPKDCSRYGECENNKIRYCPCAGGNYFDSKADACLTSAVNETCECLPLIPSVEPPPTVEPTYSYGVTPTGAGVGGGNGGPGPTAWYVIGSAAGGVVIIILLVAVIVLCCRKRRARLDKNIKIVENPEYTRRTSGIYDEIEDPPPDTAASQTNRMSTFLPTSPGVATGSAAAQPAMDDAHEYQQLLNTQPSENNAQQRNGSQDRLERSTSEEAAYMVTSLLQPKETASSNITPDITSPTVCIPMDTMPNYQNGQPADMSPSDEKHEYFELEGP